VPDGKSPLELIGDAIQEHGFTLNGRDGKMILTGYLVGREWEQISTELRVSGQEGTASSDRLRFQVDALFAPRPVCADPLNPEPGVPTVVCELEPGHDGDWHRFGAMKWTRR
jgi:hypothetical protein